jgi:hypothetical protein
MPFPKTYDELIHGGYVYSGQARCKDCNERIEWWITPEKHAMPFDLIIDPSVPVSPHLATCSHVEQFRKPKVSQ